jgi:hypothetical protein
MQSDLPGFVPADRSDVMVVYGPVEIVGRTYILPLQGVSVWRGRTLQSLSEWNENFITSGPYETRLNEFTFDHYREFRGESRMLPGYTQMPSN